MFQRDEVIKILNQAQRIDSKYELFGTSKHKYKLNPPIRASFVHWVEEKYGFVLPKDYFQFITEVGDGGAGPDYGIESFAELLVQRETPDFEKYKEAYRWSLAKSFTPRQMTVDEVEDYNIVTKECYESSPGKYFIYEKSEEDALCDTDGFFVLGTHGCQWDFGLILSGEKYGQVFDTDNEGAYGFVADSFEEFYQNWLERISDTKRLQEEINEWRARLQRRK